jgi:hypothetical protein
MLYAIMQKKRIRNSKWAFRLIYYAFDGSRKLQLKIFTSKSDAEESLCMLNTYVSSFEFKIVKVRVIKL